MGSVRVQLGDLLVNLAASVKGLDQLSSNQAAAGLCSDHDEEVD